MKITDLLSGLLLFAVAAPALAENLPVMPLRIDLPPVQRKPLHSSCADCGIPNAATIARERETRLAILLYNAGRGGPEDWAALGRFYAYEGANLKLALRWLTRAAEAGSFQAMNDLASLYHFGRPGLPPSPRLTEYWYSRAAEAGDSNAQIELASMYESGDFLPRDLTRAGRWYKRLAESGNPRRLRQAGDFFSEYGDPNLGFDYRLRAWRAGIGDVIFLCLPDPRLSADRRTAALSLCDADLDQHPRYEPGLAEALIKGDAVPKNLPRAITMLKTAVLDGNSDAAFTLAGLYERGDGVVANLNEAARLYGYAACAGRPEAKSWLAAHPGLEAPDDGFIDLPNLPEDRQAAFKAALTQASLPEDFPARALDDEIESFAVLDCQWSSAGKLEACAVIKEYAPGYGFDTASLRVAARAALPVPTSPGDHVLLRLVWQLQ